MQRSEAVYPSHYGWGRAVLCCGWSQALVAATRACPMRSDKWPASRRASCAGTARVIIKQTPTVIKCSSGHSGCARATVPRAVRRVEGASLGRIPCPPPSTLFVSGKGIPPLPADTFAAGAACTLGRASRMASASVTHAASFACSRQLSSTPQCNRNTRATILFDPTSAPPPPKTRLRHLR